MKTQLHYYSHGKLLLSGEYAVLNGAMALAVPTRPGQWLNVEEGPAEGELHWSASDINGRWFSSVYKLPALEILMTSDPVIANRLQALLKAVRELDPRFLGEGGGYKIDSHLEFHHQWGLGSSSSLVANVALWARVDPFKLFRKVSKGSGYDLACALEGKPLIYRLIQDQPEVKPVTFFPDFHDHLHFVYLGRKQDTQSGIEKYHQRKSAFVNANAAFSNLASRFLKANNLKEFCDCMQEHEALIAERIDLIPVKKRLFPDFPGEVKSLGAWGGDFVLAGSAEHPQQVRNYFVKKGMETLFTFDELILNTSEAFSFQ